jgi:hypothetical protein
MKLTISSGNSKLGKIPNFSLPPRKSCPNCKHCSGTYNGHKYSCYADKAMRMFPSAKQAWEKNLRQCKRDLAGSRRQLETWLHKHKPKWFRIHVAGDFFSQEYLDMWLWIAKAFPNTKFLAFTKSFHLDFGSKPRNLKIIYSIMPTTPKADAPRGSRAYAGPMPKTTQRVFLCPGNCETCAVCWNLKSTEHVHFDLH